MYRLWTKHSFITQDSTPCKVWGRGKQWPSTATPELQLSRTGSALLSTVWYYWVFGPLNLIKHVYTDTHTHGNFNCWLKKMQFLLDLQRSYWYRSPWWSLLGYARGVVHACKWFVFVSIKWTGFSRVMAIPWFFVYQKRFCILHVHTYWFWQPDDYLRLLFNLWLCFYQLVALSPSQFSNLPSPLAAYFLCLPLVA